MTCYTHIAFILNVMKKNTNYILLKKEFISENLKIDPYKNHHSLHKYTVILK